MPLVLVVDDDEDIRDLVAMNLEAAGYRVTTATNGREALEAVKIETPDAMFLDVMMPEVDGFTVLREIKATADEDISLIPIFMVTAVTDDYSRLRGGVEGALQYVTKPFEPARLIEMVGEVLAPGAPTERELRRAVQMYSLEALARLEAGVDEPSSEPRINFGSLENPNDSLPDPKYKQFRQRAEELNAKQVRLLQMLASGRSVIAVADELDTTRSNIYSTLKRIANKVGVSDTSELLDLARRGLLGV